MGNPSSDLTGLKNLGPTSVRWLNEASLNARADLENLGAVLAYKIVKHQRPEATLNLLYALYGALTDTHWGELPPDVKARLQQEAAAPLHVCPS